MTDYDSALRELQARMQESRSRISSVRSEEAYAQMARSLQGKTRVTDKLLEIEQRRWGVRRSQWWTEDDVRPAAWPTREAAQAFADESNARWPDERYDVAPLHTPLGGGTAEGGRLAALQAELITAHSEFHAMARVAEERRERAVKTGAKLVDALARTQLLEEEREALLEDLDDLRAAAATYQEDRYAMRRALADRTIELDEARRLLAERGEPSPQVCAIHDRLRRWLCPDCAEPAREADVAPPPAPAPESPAMTDDAGAMRRALADRTIELDEARRLLAASELESTRLQQRLKLAQGFEVLFW